MVRSLRTRILLGFTLVVLLVTFVSIWMITNIVAVGDRSAHILKEELKNVSTAQSMRQLLYFESSSVMQHLTGVTPGPATRDTIYSLQEQFHRALEHAASGTSDSAGLKILGRIASQYHQYNLRIADVMARTPEVGSASGEVLRSYATSISPLYRDVVGSVDAFRAVNYERSLAQVSAVRSGARFTAFSTTIITCIILVLSIIASLKVSQAVLAPIKQLSASVRKIAGGDFQQEISVGEADDELTGLIRDFNAMARRLQEYDATKLEQIVEEKRRCEKIVSDLSDVIVAVDENEKVIYFNNQAEIVLGLPARLILGDLLAELGGEHVVLRKMVEDIREGRFDGGEETISFRARGRDSSFAYQAQGIRNDAGEIIGYVFRLKDITRYKQLDDLKTKVVTVVSHELRTPLTSIGMSLELLAENGLGAGMDEIQKDLLRNMQEDVRRLQTFVNDLLDISKIESGTSDLVTVPEGPRELVEEAIHVSAGRTESQDIRIDATGVSIKLPKVMVDRKRIVQILNNLFSNAIRYTPYGGTIAVSAMQDGGMIRFCVRDNGPGIPLSESKQIFEKFYQIRDDQRAGGSGLGLTIVKEIVESHGGIVWVESAVGQGSSFYFTLPIAPVGSSAPEPSDK